MNKKLIRSLTCLCCGKLTRGKQWWNQDNGFGICVDCVKCKQSREYDEEEFKSCYGVSGVHYDVQDDKT